MISFFLVTIGFNFSKYLLMCFILMYFYILKSISNMLVKVSPKFLTQNPLFCFYFYFILYNILSTDFFKSISNKLYIIFYLFITYSFFKQIEREAWMFYLGRNIWFIFNNLLGEKNHCNN